MKKISVMSAFIIMVICSVLGCSSITGETREDLLGENIDDSKIYAEIQAIIADDPDARSLKIDIKVTNGAVVLAGFVNGSATEDRVTDKIKQIHGVKSVASLLDAGEK
ncbi:MAG TPA: BON domain-containing protein [Spirochaetota bacterium]